MSTLKRGLALLGAWFLVFTTGIFIGADVFWALYWLAWFFVVFLVPEVYWYVVNSRYTVSDETWRFESLNRSAPYNFAHWTPVHWVFAVVYFAFMFTLGLHLIFGSKLFGFLG